MSAKSMGYVFDESPFTGCTFLVHLVIGDLVSEAHDYELWCTQRWLQERARVSRRGVQRALEELIEGGWLSLEQDNSLAGKPNKYRFEFPVGKPRLSTETPTIGGVKVTQGGITLTQGVRQGDAHSENSIGNSKEQDREIGVKKPTGYFSPGSGWIPESSAEDPL